MRHYQKPKRRTVFRVAFLCNFAEYFQYLKQMVSFLCISGLGNGSGITDMIADLMQYGLRIPEPCQAEDFQALIYRKEKVTEFNEK